MRRRCFEREFAQEFKEDFEDLEEEFEKDFGALAESKLQTTDQRVQSAAAVASQHAVEGEAHRRRSMLFSPLQAHSDEMQLPSLRLVPMTQEGQWQWCADVPVQTAHLHTRPRGAKSEHAVLLAAALDLKNKQVLSKNRPRTLKLFLPQFLLQSAWNKARLIQRGDLVKKRFLFRATTSDRLSDSVHAHRFETWSHMIGVDITSAFYAIRINTFDAASFRRVDMVSSFGPLGSLRWRRLPMGLTFSPTLLDLALTASLSHSWWKPAGPSNIWRTRDSCALLTRYVDDFVISAVSSSRCAFEFKRLSRLLQFYGFHVNPEKTQIFDNSVLHMLGHTRCGDRLFIHRVWDPLPLPFRPLLPVDLQRIAGGLVDPCGVGGTVATQQLILWWLVQHGHTDPYLTFRLLRQIHEAHRRLEKGVQFHFPSIVDVYSDASKQGLGCVVADGDTPVFRYAGRLSHRVAQSRSIPAAEAQAFLVAIRHMLHFAALGRITLCRFHLDSQSVVRSFHNDLFPADSTLYRDLVQEAQRLLAQAPFQFSVVHIPGERNPSDRLSRIYRTFQPTSRRQWLKEQLGSAVFASMFREIWTLFHQSQGSFSKSSRYVSRV